MKKTSYRILFFIISSLSCIHGSAREKRSVSFEFIKLQEKGRSNSMPMPIPAQNQNGNEQRSMSPFELKKQMEKYKEIHQKIIHGTTSLKTDKKESSPHKFLESPFFPMDDDPSEPNNKN